MLSSFFVLFSYLVIHSSQFIVHKNGKNMCLINTNIRAIIMEMRDVQCTGK